MDPIKAIDDNINNMLKQFVRKPTIVRGVVHLLLILYAAWIAPKLPKQVYQLFENAYFKLFVFSLILWTAQFSPVTSILIALGFMVTVNFVNRKPLWEFLENVDPSTSMAPSKEVAIDSAVSIMDTQSANAPAVDTVAQKENTIIVQPSIVETANGTAVVNPTVVVAPAIVENSQGEKVIINPDVTMLEPKQQPAPVAAEEAAPAAPAAPKEAAVAVPADNCYPLRKYDMAQVQPLSFDDFSEFKA